MNGPYIHQGWAPFSYKGLIYDLSHLNEITVEVKDSSCATRKIAVTFADHCFTRDRKSDEEREKLLDYPGCSRDDGIFCFRRYEFSKLLPEMIPDVVKGDVWNVQDDRCACVPTIDQNGQCVLYGIIFSLEKVKGLPVKLHMRVRSAYPLDEDDKELITYGCVRFPHLVALASQGKRPMKLTDQKRKKPILGKGKVWVLPAANSLVTAIA